MDTSDLDPDPVAQLRAWLDEAEAAGMHEPTAMVVATASTAGQPSARYVLLRGLDDRGLAFYTNYDSAKAREIDANEQVAAVLGWTAMYRQVRVTGTIARVSDADSDAYFATRARGSQIGAWASPQSQEIASRSELERLVASYDERFSDLSVPVPRPPHWGGLRIVPAQYEFWQGQRDRLHDRIRYTADGDGWTQARLAP